MDDWTATAVTTIGLAGDLAALEPRAGEAREAVSRARDWLLAASMERQGPLSDPLPDAMRAVSLYERVPMAPCRRAAEELEQARDGVPPDAAADYEGVLAALRRLAPSLDVLCTPEHKRILADYEAWSWGDELAQQHWPRQWEEHPSIFASWIEDERKRLGVADAAAVMSIIRRVAGQSGDDHEAAATYMVQTYSHDDITAWARVFWLNEYDNDEEFARRLNDVGAIRELDAITTLVALRIEAVWRRGEQGGSYGGDPHGAAQGDDPDIVRAVAEDTLWMADRLWDGSHAGVSRWAECSSELARALGPLAAAVGKWRDAGQPEDRTAR